MNQIEYQRSIIKEEMLDGQEEAMRILTAAKAKEVKDREENWEHQQAKEFSTLTLPVL